MPERRPAAAPATGNVGPVTERRRSPHHAPPKKPGRQGVRRGHVPVLQPSTVMHPCPERTDDQDLSKPGAANRKVTIIKSGVQKPAVRLQDVASGQQKCTKPDREGAPGSYTASTPRVWPAGAPRQTDADHVASRIHCPDQAETGRTLILKR